ncbi:MAG: repair protein SbcD/Mre11 [Frankiales bacterium]|nr:repair protein SbcD/Mre11 [Frankiales bacterium]
MRILHTSDWHIGKVLKGHSRMDEQKAVMAEIIEISDAAQVDLILIPGDLYDTAAPTPEAQQLVVETLLALAQTGARVIAMAGNHDNARTFDAYRPLMAAAKIELLGTPRGATDGGVIEVITRSGEGARVAALPFLSQKYAVRAAQIVSGTAMDNTSRYDEVIRRMVGSLTDEFGDDTVNILMAHLTVTNGQMGGGELAAHTIFEYHVPAQAFPESAHYVALGHLHRTQSLPAACPVHYCGSPIAIDFGEQDNTRNVLLVEATANTPAVVSPQTLAHGRVLRTITGTLDELAGTADGLADCWLRVVLKEKSRAGLREQVQELLPGTLELRIHPDFQASAVATPSTTRQLTDRTPAQMFDAYLSEQGVEDPRLGSLFRELHDEYANNSGASDQAV